MKENFRIIVVLFIFSFGGTSYEEGAVVNDPYIGRCLAERKICHPQAACVPDEFDTLKYECKCANGWVGDGKTECFPPDIFLSVAPGMECNHSTLNTCFTTAHVGNALRMSVQPHGNLFGDWEIKWYKIHAGLPPLYHSYKENLQIEDTFDDRMEFGLSNSILNLYELQENDIYPNRFIAEIVPTDSLEIPVVRTSPIMQSFDISEEETMNPPVTRVYFMIEQEPIVIGPVSSDGPEVIDLEEHLPPAVTDVDRYLPHYRWAIERDVETINRRGQFLPMESEQLLNLRHLDDDELKSIVRGMVYGKNERVPGRVLLASVRFRLKEDESRICSGPISERVCTCRLGYTLNGTRCIDVDECRASLATCLPEALCLNTEGSYYCQCPNGYVGDGLTFCSDFDECTRNNTCHPSAVCSNTQGSFICTCQFGYVGDGFDCSVVSTWSGWSEWSPCMESCGESQRIRTRYCTHQESGMICFGNPDDVEECIGNPPCPVHGGWSEWSVWSSCTASCDGQRQRVRMCDNPTPEFGGLFCDGDMYTIDMCGDLSCPVPGDWGAWEEWSECSHACDGTQRRYRSCEPRRSLGRPDAEGLCPTGDERQTRTCSLEEDPVYCNHGYTKKIVTSPGWSRWSMWNEWNHWSYCSLTCGEGRRYRRRTCKTKTSGHDADIQRCEGSHREVQPCFERPCTGQRPVRRYRGGR